MFIFDVLESCPAKSKLSISYFKGDTSEFEAYIEYTSKNDITYFCKYEVSFENNKLSIACKYDGVFNHSLKTFNSFTNSLINYYKDFDLSVEAKVKKSYDVKEVLLDILLLR